MNLLTIKAHCPKCHDRKLTLKTRVVFFGSDALFTSLRGCRACGHHPPNRMALGGPLRVSWTPPGATAGEQAA